MLWCSTERWDLWWQALIANEFLFSFKEGQIYEWYMHVRLSKDARNQSLRQEAQRRNSFNSLHFWKYYLRSHSYTFHDFVCSEIQTVTVMIRVRPLACLSIMMKGLVVMFYIWIDVIIKGFLILCSYFSVLKMNYNFIISWIRGSVKSKGSSRYWRSDSSLLLSLSMYRVKIQYFLSIKVKVKVQHFTLSLSSCSPAFYYTRKQGSRIKVSPF